MLLPERTPPPTLPVQYQGPVSTVAPATIMVIQPTRPPRTHIVSSGETLGIIASLYGLSLEEIIAVNGITDPNQLFVGQELIAELPPTPMPTDTPTAVPESARTPIPTVAIELGESSLAITRVVTAENVDEAQFDLVNSGTTPAQLDQWTLTVNDQTYRFANTVLFGSGAAITLHAGAGQNGATDLYWGLETPAWQPGDEITLRDADNALRIQFTIPE